MVLVQAYKQAFVHSDDVALVVHSSYGDRFWERELESATQDFSGPAVLLIQVQPAQNLPTSQIFKRLVSNTIAHICYRLL